MNYHHCLQCDARWHDDREHVLCPWCAGDVENEEQEDARND